MEWSVETRVPLASPLQSELRVWADDKNQEDGKSLSLYCRLCAPLRGPGFIAQKTYLKIIK